MRRYGLVSGVFFTALCGAQLTRLAMQWPVNVAGYDVPLWISMTVWPLLPLVLALVLLQPVKGAVIGLQYTFGMHGFGKLPPARGGSGTGTGERRGGEAGSRAGAAPKLGSA